MQSAKSDLLYLYAMKIKNTSRIATEKIRPLLEFASRRVNDSRVEVHIKHSRSDWFSGMAYANPHGNCFCSVDARTKYLITLKIPPRKNNDNVTELCYWSRLKRLQLIYPDGFPLETWEDQVIKLTAHEFRHIWQFQRSRKTGKRGKGEYDAEKHALVILNKWRIYTNRQPIPKQKQRNPFA